MTTTVLDVPSDVSTSAAETLSSDTLLFRDLPLSDEVQLAVQMTGYLSPTDVQAQIIPHVLDGRDVLAQSQTGTGKTAAFALPILSRLEMNGPSAPQVLVLAPTRELATQVAESFKTYGACMPKLRIAAIYGGSDYEPQLRALRKGVHVVVGTPGRVLDHIKRGTLSLDSIRCLVLDEADEMLNMGFLEDVEFVLQNTPAEKQIALFSATMPHQIRRIADQHLKEPATVTIGRKAGLTADSIEQRCVFVNEGDKPEMLARMLEAEETDGVIVFTKTKDSTVAVADRLCALGLSAAALNGDLPQARRQRTVDQLKSGHLNILVATDVAARGLDVQRISHVFNYDLPHDSESYVHRIGRTGRAGRSGVAVIFLTFRQRGKLRLIERATNQPIAVVEPPKTREINLKRIERFKAQMKEILSSGDLSLFKKMVEEVAAETQQPMEIVAAAAAKLARGDQPLLVSDLPKSASFDAPHGDRRERGPRGDRGERGGREFRSDFSSSRDGGGAGRRPSGPPRQGMERYKIEVGRDDGVRPANIVGAIANEAGISGSDIGSIDIRGNYSTIDLPEGMPKDVFQLLQKTWVSGKQLRIKLCNASNGYGAAGNDGAEASGRPFKKFKSPPPHVKSKKSKKKS